MVEEVLKEHRQMVAAMERVRVVAGKLNRMIAAGEAAMHDASQTVEAEEGEFVIEGEEFVIDLDEMNDERRIFVEDEERTLKEA